MSLPAPKSDGRARLSWAWASLLLLLALAPLPFGSNRPWAWSLMALWASLMLLGWAVALLLGRRQLVWRPALLAPALMAATLIGWIFLTLLPDLGLAHPVWQIASEQLGQTLPRRQTMAIETTMVATIRLGAYLVIFWLALQYGRNRDRAEQLLAWLSWVGMVYALYGLINFFAGNPYLLWYPRWAGAGDVTATFVNRNHYATFAGLTMIASMAVAMTAYRRAWQLSDRSQPTLSRMLECLAGRPIVYFLVTLVIATAWMQSHSRMGLAAVALGIVVMLALMMSAKLIRRGIAPWVILVLAGLFLVQISGAGTLSRLGGDGEEDRWKLFAVVSDEIGSAPYTGSGYGSFAQAFPMYRDFRLPGKTIYAQAHNSYLELAAELGIPATVLFVGMILWCALLCLIAVFRRQRDQLYAIVGVAASVVVGAHALFDFSPQIPAVAAVYAALLGMGVAQSWSQGQRK